MFPGEVKLPTWALLVILGLIVVIVVLTLLGPMIGTVYSCPPVACPDGVTIYFEGPLPPDHTFEAVTDAGRFAYVCRDGQRVEGTVEGVSLGQCTTWLEIHGLKPKKMTITVTWEGGGKTETFYPVYEAVGPERCMDCHRARVVVELPGG
jgi:hypothetical protein